MKFILTKDGEAFNPARANFFYINTSGNYFDVLANDALAKFPHYDFFVARFDTEDEAKNYIAQIVSDLNKLASRWIKLQRSELLNIDSYSRFQIQKYTGAGREDYCVVGYGKYDGEPYTIQVVDTVDDAQKYLDDLLEKLNGVD